LGLYHNRRASASGFREFFPDLSQKSPESLKNVLQAGSSGKGSQAKIRSRHVLSERFFCTFYLLISFSGSA
jgi:hypothetical protein